MPTAAQMRREIVSQPACRSAARSAIVAFDPGRMTNATSPGSGSPGRMNTRSTPGSSRSGSKSSKLAMRG
jgi:hypothetical protein